MRVLSAPRPAREAIAANRAIDKVLVAARGGDEDFAPLHGTRYEVEALARLFQSDDRPTRIFLGPDTSEQELSGLASSGQLGRFGFIHLAAHGVIDEAVPQRSAVILAQTDLPDPLEQVLNHKPAFDGRLTVREIQPKARPPAEIAGTVPSGAENDKPYALPHYWAAFVLAGDPD